MSTRENIRLIARAPYIDLILLACEKPSKLGTAPQSCSGASPKPVGLG